MELCNNSGPNDNFTCSLQDEVELQREDEGKKALRVTNNQTLMEVEESVGNARINEKNVLYDTTKYERIIYWSKEDECWVAEVPELAGCSADGKTALEALCNSE